MKLSSILLSAVVCVSFAFAQATPPAATPVAEKKAPAAKAEVKKLTGVVVSVDAVANTVVVKVKEGKGAAATEKEETVAVDKNTKIKQGSKVVTLADLKAEASVRVTAKVEEGKLVATEIVEKVAAAKPAPKAEEKK